MSTSAHLGNENPDQPAEHNETVDVQVPGGGVKVPLPRWAIRVLSVYLVVSAPLFIGLWLWHMKTDNISSQEKQQRIAELQKDSELLVQTQKKMADADRQLANLLQSVDSMTENMKHNGESGELLSTSDSELKVTHFRSDGCVAVLHFHGGRAVGGIQWVKNPAGAGQQPNAPGATDGGKEGAQAIPGQPGVKPSDAAGLHVSDTEAMAELRMVDMNVSSGRFLPAVYTPPSGRCLNPHPGRYNSWTGRAQGCWIQVWHRWDDGCVNYQWFNTCASSWDADSRGKPRFYWTACNH